MLTTDMPKTQAVAGENAVFVTQLPPVWQAIAHSQIQLGCSNPHAYVEMAQLFQYKLSQGDVDLFQERSDLNHLRVGFADLFGTLATETLEFYGQDFQMQNYPNFVAIQQAAIAMKGIDAPEVKVAQIAIDLFEEFGYELPASFYQVHLAPMERDHIFEERALRFDPREQGHKRSWDAILHACKVFAMQMKIQSIASKYGFTYHHGCGCESHLASIDRSSGSFDYELQPAKRQRWIRSFIWTAWYEYAFFPIVPNTRYLV